MATSSNLISALGAGSGVDVKSLAEGLVEAERAPQKGRIDAKIAKSEAKISGYGAMLSYLEQFKATFEKLNAPSDFGGLTQTNSQPVAFTATLASGATPVTQSINVLQLASAQRTRSAEFASPTANLTDGVNSLKLSLTVGEQAAQEIEVGTSASPTDIVAAINQSTAAQSAGVSAKLVRYVRDDAIRYSIELQGGTGADQIFSLAVDPSSYAPAAGGSSTPPLLQASVLSQAGDAVVSFGGQTVTATSNTVTDPTGKITLSLAATTASPATLSLTRDLKATRENIQAVVTSYNDLQEAFKQLADSGSEIETLGGSLAGDRLLQTVRSQLRNLMRGPDTGSSGINRLSDLGISVDKFGRMQLQPGSQPGQLKLDEVLASNYEGVMRMFSGDPASVTQKKGLADNMLDALSDMTGDFGVVAKQSKAVKTEVSKYKDQLVQLEDRMTKLLERYTRQFSIMESLVGNTNSLKTSLKSSFEGMMEAYK